MPSYERDGAVIHFDDEGDGFPVLLIAPGGMRSANEIWTTTSWNPRAALADSYRLIGMDQRNAGRSRGPVSGDDGWDTYRDDQLGVLDHLGIDRCHVVGMCIGGPYIAGLLTTAPERFASAVMLQPVGIDDNRGALEEMFDAWRAVIEADHPEVDDAGWARFRSNMWGGEFVLTATPDEVTSIATPILLCKGDDLYHPAATSEELARLAPNVTFVERWKDEEVLADTDATIKEFLASHTPG
jgi:pimeloyl-ACP methyl ester carboxylesterase